MSKIPTIVAFAAVLASAAPMANAQTSPGHERYAAVTSATPGEIIQPDQIRASKMIGSAVYDVQNRKIGTVQDLVLNKDGTVAATVVDVGSFLGMGGKDVAVKLSDIKTNNNRLTLDLTKEQLQRMAAYQLENRNTGAGTSTSPVEGGHLGTGSGTAR